MGHERDFTEETRETAARVLYEELERIDSCDGRSWDELPEGDRHIYRKCIDALVPVFKKAIP